MSQRFSLDRQSFEQFIGAVSIFQSLEQAARKRNTEQYGPVLLHLLETVRAVDSGELPLQPALERVASLTLHIVGGDGAAVWLSTNSDLTCRAAAGLSIDNDQTREAIHSKLHPEAGPQSDTPRQLEAADALQTVPAPDGPSSGSSLAIAVLPGRDVTGALAVFSLQSATFTDRDSANLTLLAGLVQYILKTLSAPMPVDDLYVPGVGTRAALGGDDREPILVRAVLRERAERLKASTAGLISSATGATRRGVVAGTSGIVAGSKRVGNTAVHAGQDFTNGLRISGKATISSLENVQERTSKVWVAAKSAADGLKSAAASERPAISVDQTMRKLRRLLFWSRKLMLEAHEEISETRERFNRWRSVAIEKLTTGLSRTESTLTKQAKHSRDRLQPLLAAMGVKTVESTRRLQARASDVVGGALESARNISLNWPALRKAAPSIAVLAVISYFALLLTTGRQPMATPLNSTAQAATGPVAHVSAGSASRVAPAILSPKETPPGPFQASHLQVTDRETEITLAALSTYEIRTLRRAADYGDDEAALQLGMLYELGRGFRQSCTQAAEWVTKSAEYGNANAEYNLGLRYRDGDGVEANLQQAEHWLRKAAAHKNSNAERALVTLPAHEHEAEASNGRIAQTSQLAIRTQ